MEDIALLIRDQRFEEAFQNIGTLVGQGLPTLNAHRLWAKIYANQTFEESDVIFEGSDLSPEIHEAIRLFHFLRNTKWDITKKNQYQSATKQVVLKVANQFRQGYRRGAIVNPELLVNIQDFINMLDEANAVIDKADVSAVKASISGTLLQLKLVEQYKFGSDMLQYAANYASVGKEETAKQIYESIIKDFKPRPGNDFKQVFPEVQFIEEEDDPKLLEQYVYDKATFELNKLKGISSTEPKEMILDEELYFHKIAMQQKQQRAEEEKLEKERKYREIFGTENNQKPKKSFFNKFLNLLGGGT